MMLLFFVLPGDGHCQIIIFRDGDFIAPCNPLVTFLETPDLLDDLLVAFGSMLFAQGGMDSVEPFL